VPVRAECNYYSARINYSRITHSHLRAAAVLDVTGTAAARSRRTSTVADSPGGLEQRSTGRVPLTARDLRAVTSLGVTRRLQRLPLLLKLTISAAVACR